MIEACRHGLTSGLALLLLSMVAASEPATVAAPVYLGIEAVAPVSRTRDPLAQQWIVYVDGPFESGAAARLAGFLAQQGISRASVYLNSPGGSLIEGMAIGRLLREQRFDTHVGRRTADPRKPAVGVCYSACPFAYAGGLGRFLGEGSVLGIHRVTNRVAVPDEFAFEQVVSGQAVGYLTEMGIDARLFQMMERSPVDEIRLLTRAEALHLKLVNDSGP